jgi:hypothetical protein
VSPRRRPVDYSTLTASERVALVLRAQARGDRDDARRLLRDAPTADYRITDPRVTDPLDDAHRLVSWALAVERPALADAATADVMLNILPRWVGLAAEAASWHVYKALTADGVPISNDELDGLLDAAHDAVRERFDALLDALQQRARCCVHSVVETWSAVDQVSRALFGVDGETLAAAMLPAELRTTVTIDVAPDPHAVAEIVTMLLAKLGPEGEP